jgi:predicted ester cyclase
MRGFDNRWEDFPHYILGITEEIWEKRGLGARMRDYYHPDVIVRMPGGVSVGEPAATRATMATLTEFPDRVLLGEDVIWSGTPEAGMLSSHRILSTATHAGDGMFGPATGKRVTWRAIADCWARDGQIADEWLVRDNGAVLRQLGHDPRDWVAARLAAGTAGTPFTPASDVAGPYGGSGNDHELGEVYADLLTRIMTAEFSVIAEEWDRACHLEYPGGLTAHGPAAADRFWMGLRSSFPSARFDVHHMIGREDALMPPRAALRFSLTGRHDGWGAFGAPTGAEVHVMGIAHAEFGPWGLRREWALYDETAIWTQILTGAG